MSPPTTKAKTTLPFTPKKGFGSNTCLKGEVIHHLQSAHNHEIWPESSQFCSKLLHGGQVGVVIIAVNDVPTEDAT